MAADLNLDDIQDIETTPASSFKTLGWRQLMKRVAAKGKLLVTNHSEREAVILSVAEYQAMLRLIRQSVTEHEDVLDALRRRFDLRLAALEQADAGDRLRSVMQAPARLQGKVRAGERH